MRDLAEIVGDLERVQFVGDYMTRLYELSDELEQLPDGRRAIEPVFRFLEVNADKDLGAPGPLVHFIEAVPGHEEVLLQSLRRTPTALTVWMLNRLVNVRAGEERNMLLGLMRGIAQDASAHRTAREAARDLLQYQEGAV